MAGQYECICTREWDPDDGWVYTVEPNCPVH